MESCRDEPLPQLKGSLPDGSASRGDLVLWKIEVEKFFERCWKQHQDLIDYVRKELKLIDAIPAAEDGPIEKATASGLKPGPGLLDRLRGLWPGSKPR